MPKIIIVIDAEIGAGKSTLLNILDKLDIYHDEKKLNIVCIQEPVDIWKNEGVLDDFYSNIKQNSYKFQTYAFITRVKRCIETYEQHPTADIFILERSIFSDRYIFVEMLHKDGLFTDLEYQIYTQWWTLWEKIMPFKPTMFIYLSTDLPECYNRIKKRNRDSESSIKYSYLESLHSQHKQFITYISDFYPTYTLDGNVNYTTDEGKNIIKQQFIDIVLSYLDDN